MKFKNIIYIFLMVLFTVLAYLFFDRGINTRTKIYVNYKENSDVIYRVYLKENDIYDKEYLNMNQRYVTNLVDYINMKFNYKSFYSRELNGYYSYDVITSLVIYEDNINDTLWKKDYILIPNKVEVLNTNNLKNINILDNIKINYNQYRNELNKYKEDYGIDVSGYLEVKFLLKENFNFSGIDKILNDEKEIKVIIPLSYDSFRINIINDNNNTDSYYDFSKKEKVNYLLLIIASFNLSLGISFLALTIRNILNDMSSQSLYIKELKKINNEYGDILVKVKKFYNEKKYNLIYVDSFKELIDVYNKIGNPISYKEIKKNVKTIFLIMDEDNAWIYQMTSKNIK